MGVVERRLGAAEHRVDARDLPLAASEVRLRSDLAPVVAGGVRGVDHLVVLLRRAIRQLDQRPDMVEEVDRQLAALLLRQRRRRASSSVVAHGRRSYAFPRSSYTKRGMARDASKRPIALWVTPIERNADHVRRDGTDPTSRDPAALSDAELELAPAASSSARSSRSRGAARGCTPGSTSCGREATPRPIPSTSPSRRCRRPRRRSRSTPSAARADRRAPRRVQPPPPLGRPGCAATYSATTNFGTTVDQASTTSSCISSMLIASSRTWTQLKRMSDALGSENFVGVGIDERLPELLRKREAHHRLIVGEREPDDLADAELEPAVDDDLVRAWEPGRDGADVSGRHR